MTTPCSHPAPLGRHALRITELAAAERVAQPTMTGIVRRLEVDGLVARTPDPDDARAALEAALPALDALLAAEPERRP